MNIRTFAIGLLCGAGLYATIDFLLLHRSSDDPVVLVNELTIEPPMGEATENAQPSLESVRAYISVEPILNESPAAVAPPKFDWLQSARAALDSEPKDEAWAYFNEQAISQFLFAHADFVGFDVEYIECRTTKCQIRVAGYDESTGPTWQKILYEMYQEPWAEFGQTGNARGKIGGRFIILETMHRTVSQR